MNRVVCEKCFRESGTFETHMLSVNTNEKPYECDVCDEAFQSTWSFENPHAYSHERETV